jgi:HPt (histidine-containing phosphotransfer) domain-containing protein
VTTDDVRAALVELARELATVLPARADAIAAAFARARANPESSEAREELRGLAHRMRGTAGSHGFHDLSVEAGSIEDEILSRAGSVIPESAWALLAARVESIRAGAARAADDAAKAGA